MSEISGWTSDWTNTELISALKLFYPETNEQGNHVTSIETELKQLKLELDPMKPSVVTKYIGNVYKIFISHSQNVED